MKTTTFGDTTVDTVLAEHLTEFGDQARWATRVIGKTVQALHDLQVSGINTAAFAVKVFHLISAELRQHVENPPAHIQVKTATFTANIVKRKLREYYRAHIGRGKVR
jgi:hypothetical protein